MLGPRALAPQSPVAAQVPADPSRVSACVLNVNGFPAREAIRFLRVDELVQRHDVVALCESKQVEPAAVSAHFPSRRVFCAPATTKGRCGQGLALLLSERVSQGARLWRCRPGHGYQSLWVQVPGAVFGLAECVLIAVVYVPPVTDHRTSAEVEEMFGVFADELAAAELITPHMLILGDFNAHLGSLPDCAPADPSQSGLLAHHPHLLQPRLCSATRKKPNDAGKALLGILAEYDLTPTTGRGKGDDGAATCRAKKKQEWSTRPDHVLVSPSLLSMMCVAPGGVAVEHWFPQEFDHRPVTAVFSLPVAVAPRGEAEPQAQARPPPFLRWKAQSQSAYVAKLCDELPVFQAAFGALLCGPGADVDVGARVLSDLIEGAAGQAQMLVRPRAGGGQAPKGTAPWFDAECAAARRARDDDLRRHLPIDVYRERKQAYKALLRRKERAYLQLRATDFLALLEKSRGEAIRSLAPRRARQPSPVSQEQWQAELGPLFRPAHPPDVLSLDNLPEVPPERPALPTVTLGQVTTITKAALSRLRDGSAAGFDGIGPAFLKQALGPPEDGSRDPVNVLAPLLSRLFLACYESGKVPAQWKVARLSPLFKKGDDTLPCNYRMLAVSSVLYRLYASVLRELLTTWVVASQVVPVNQFGFYPKRGCQQAQFILQHLIMSRRKAPKGPKSLLAVFVDFKQAYDLVNRAALWKDLERRVGVPAPLMRAMQGLYEEDSYVLVDGEKRTEPVHPTHGVKQGCPLSPMLFSLFISDVSARLDVAAGGDSVTGAAGPGGGSVSHLLFADDLTLVALNKECMNRMLEALAVFCADKGMVVNVAKTKAVLFSASTRAVPTPSLVYKGEEVEFVREFMYLGLPFSANMSFTRMAERWEGPLRGGCAKASALARDRGVHRNLHAALLLLQTFGFPCMMYGCQIWGACFLSAVKLFTSPLQRIHAQAVRRVFGLRQGVAHRVLLQEAGVRPLQSYWLSACLKFWNVCVDDVNPLVQVAVRGEAQLLSRLQGARRKSWLSMVTAAVEELGADVQFVSDEGGPVKVDKEAVERAWNERWSQQWADVGTDPRAEEVESRRLVVYKAHFLLNPPSAFTCPAYLSTTNVSWCAVRALAQFRMGMAPLRTITGVREEEAVAFRDRVCLRCPAGHPTLGIDDEQHLLFECAATHAVRMDHIGFLSTLPQRNVRDLMAHQDLSAVADFVADCVHRAEPS
jgi:hypothetical protein